jgi:hypothetical protein
LKMNLLFAYKMIEWSVVRWMFSPYDMNVSVEWLVLLRRVREVKISARKTLFRSFGQMPRCLKLGHDRFLACRF